MTNTFFLYLIESDFLVTTPGLDSIVVRYLTLGFSSCLTIYLLFLGYNFLIKCTRVG